VRLETTRPVVINLIDAKQPNSWVGFHKGKRLREQSGLNEQGILVQPKNQCASAVREHLLVSKTQPVDQPGDAMGALVPEYMPMWPSVSHQGFISSILGLVVKHEYQMRLRTKNLHALQSVQRGFLSRANGDDDCY
jgi:hypothetical protein